MTTPAPRERTGACLCGRIKYRVLGESVYDTFCHCIPCRKWTGSVAFTAAICPKEGFTILSGLPHLKSYNDPTTDSGTPLTRNFCGECGSAVFSCTPLYPDIVGVAAGTLEKFEEWKPNVEQFCIRRAGFLEKCKGVEPERRHTTHAQSEPEAQ